jgi:hypothetical protein
MTTLIVQLLPFIGIYIIKTLYIIFVNFQLYIRGCSKSPVKMTLRISHECLLFRSSCTFLCTFRSLEKKNNTFPRAMRNQRSFPYAQSYAASNCDAQIFTVGRVIGAPGRCAFSRTRSFSSSFLNTHYYI